MTKTCPKCKTAKALAQFYGDKSSGDGKSCWCKTCIDAKPRRQTEARLVRNRARQRASQLLIELYREQFEALYARCLQEATGEAAALVADERAQQLFPEGVPPRLRPGPGRESTPEVARLDTSWCETCRKYHANDHLHVVPAKLTPTEIVEDFLHLRKGGDNLEAIARAMHMTPAALDIAMRRAGRGDLLRKKPKPIAS